MSNRPNFDELKDWQRNRHGARFFTGPGSIRRLMGDLLSLAAIFGTPFLFILTAHLLHN